MRLHQASGLAGGSVVDADDLGQRMVAERLDILAGDPAGTENGYAVLLSQFLRTPPSKTVGSLWSPDHGVKEREGGPDKYALSAVIKSCRLGLRPETGRTSCCPGRST